MRLPRVLRRIAKCESGGDPTAVSAGGRYRGKFQFTRATWRALGGSGDPAEASEATQDRLALKLYRRSGTDPWPTCARSGPVLGPSMAAVLARSSVDRACAPPSGNDVSGAAHARGSRATATSVTAQVRPSRP